MISMVLLCLIGWFAKATVLFSFPISTYIIHKSTGNSYFVTSQIDISQARPYSRFFTLIHSILIISVFINEPQCQNTTSTRTHQNEFVGFEIQSIMTPFPRAFMRYCQHLIRGVFLFPPLLGYSVFLFVYFHLQIHSFHIQPLLLPNSITTLNRHYSYNIPFLSSITLCWSSTILFFLTI